MNKKLVIAINGKGGVGKDSLCDALAEAYKVTNISAITPIKNIAAQYGWNGGKDDKSRKFLADLKRVFSEYNDLPNQYLLGEYEKFLQSDADILTVHIRECDQIEKFVSAVKIPCITLLVKRAAVDENHVYGNAADDDVDRYSYDYTFCNDAPLEESSKEFIRFVGEIIDRLYD